ncbi:MAG: hypothetical protein ACHQRM_03170 [Bacteroidia bacterium]
MKVAVKYGIIISIVQITLKLILVLTRKDAQFVYEGLSALLFIFAGGLWLSISATQTKEYKGAANPVQLLKAGLTTSGVFGILFSLFAVGLKVAQNDLPPGSTAGMMIMGVLFLVFLLLMTGGLLSVFISYIVSRRKS